MLFSYLIPEMEIEPVIPILEIENNVVEL